MMIDAVLRRRLFAVAAMVTPLVLVQVMRSATGMGLAASRASEAAKAVATPPAEEASAPKALSKEQKAIAAWLAQSGPLHVERSPMLEPKPVAVQQAEAKSAEPEAKPGGPRTALSLRAIMTNDAGAIALINGKTCRVGDEVEPGWAIEAIDAKKLSVTLKGPGGREFELLCAKRGDNQ